MNARDDDSIETELLASQAVVVVSAGNRFRSLLAEAHSCVRRVFERTALQAC
jgi:hypothetical protein